MSKWVKHNGSVIPPIKGKYIAYKAKYDRDDDTGLWEVAVHSDHEIDNWSEVESYIVLGNTLEEARSKGYVAL